MMNLRVKKNPVLLISIFLVAFFTIAAAAQNAVNKGYDGILKDIQVKFDILKSHHINMPAEIKKFDAIKQYIDDLNKIAGEKNSAGEIKVLNKLIELETTSLDNNLRLKITSVKRLELLYLIMLVFSSLIAVGFAFYIVVMYNRRK
jgi:hypothetical protein